MAIQPVQFNSIQADSQNGRVVKPYREAEGAVETKGMVKPLPPKGHLVDDNLATGTKYFFKDIAYDMKSVKNGFNGTANDHQLGRLNDVGLRLGGIAIATYLASRTTNPKARLMEYVGLAAFLTSMAIYPKIAINTPARILHGYDIDKQYIDDQGRKKSVQQDSNYVPYDMYIGANKGEDLDTIGDKMGIPRDIKNRHDVIREQMRKIATQNNTLWMLTAGFATPLMTALICSGIEKFVVSPGLEKARNAKYNSKIQNMLTEAGNMASDLNNVSNSLSESVKSILYKYEGKALPAEEYEKLVNLLTKGNDVILSEGIKEDLGKMLNNQGSITISDKTLKEVYEEAKMALKGRNKKYVAENFIPSMKEIENLVLQLSEKPDQKLSEGVQLTGDKFNELRIKILDLAKEKIEKAGLEDVNYKESLINNVSNFEKAFNIKPTSNLSKESIESVIKFAKILGDFQAKSAILDKCENFKFEHTPESVLANYYEKFQTTLLKELDISPKDYKRMSNDREFAQKVLDKKFRALCENEAKYQKTFEKLAQIMEDMETALHGESTDNSQIKDLINGIEKVYDKTAQRLRDNNIGEATAKSLQEGGISEIGSVEDLYKLLDNMRENKYLWADAHDAEAIRYFANGKGSSKNIKISRLLNRYQGETNSFFRIFHTLDVYKRFANIRALVEYSTGNSSVSNEALEKEIENLLKHSSIKDIKYVEQVSQQIKEMLLKGDISDFTMKVGIEDANQYKDFYNIGWAVEEADAGKITQKGSITEASAKSLEKHKKGNLLERFQYYISRFRNIIGNDKTDFTKPNHILDEQISNSYMDIAKTNESKFNLVGQNPVDMLQKAAGKKHADRMWLKTVGIMTGAIFGVTLLAQFSFGKISNKHNLQKLEKTDNKEKKMQVQK